MKPTDVMAITLLVLVTMTGSAGIIAAEQGRAGATDLTIVTGFAAALIAGALGVVAGRKVFKGKDNDENPPSE